MPYYYRTTTLTPISSSYVNNDNNNNWIFLICISIIIFTLVCLMFHLLIIICVHLFYRDQNMDELSCLKKFILNYNSFILKRPRDNIDFRIHVRKNLVNRIIKIKNFNENDNLNEIECPICIEKIKNKYAEMPCGHIFKIKCIKKWLIYEFNNTCPICRYNIMESYRVVTEL